MGNNFRFGDDVVKKLNELKGNIPELKAGLGVSIAENLKKEVIKNIPNSGGWFKIYKEAIDIAYLDGEWIVKGEKDVPFKVLDATKTLVYFNGEDPASGILAKYNPWTVDMIPAISESYTKLVAKAASDGEIISTRSRLKNSMIKVQSDLQKEGFTISENELPKFGSTIVADLNFLAQRLEYGLAGFPRVQVFSNASNSLTANFSKVMEENKNIEYTLSKAKTIGAPSSKLKAMISSAIRKNLSL